MPVINEKPIPYIIPVGKEDKERLLALGAIYDETSSKLLEYCNLKNPKILDVGCGSGGLTRLFAKIIGSTVVGVDISSKQIGEAKKGAEEDNLTNITWDICDVYHLKDLEKKHPDLFDIVHSRFVLTHLTEPEKAVDQMLSMVKPGGILILEETGAKKTFKGSPPRAIQAWKELVKHQYELQQSHEDTIERVLQHLSHPFLVTTCDTKLFDIKVEGQLKKSLYRLGVEIAVKKFEELGESERLNKIVKEFGYADQGVWLKELKEFEIDDSQTLEIQNYECIVATKN